MDGRHLSARTVSRYGMQAAMERTCDVRFRSIVLWPDSCDDALNHVGVFQSYLEKIS
jgi:nitrile hydratase